MRISDWSSDVCSSDLRVSVLAHASCDLLRPLHYPATVIVGLVVTRVGRSSLELDVTIEVEGAPGVIYAKGRNVMVVTDRSEERRVGKECVITCRSGWSAYH